MLILIELNFIRFVVKALFACEATNTLDTLVPPILYGRV